MFKALVKKQLVEMLNSFSRKKGGARRGAGGMAIFVVLLGAIIAMLFTGISFIVAESIKKQGAEWWIYFALIGIMTTLVGVLGSVFNTYTALYSAKDNELLLAMPVRPSLILLARMLGVYVFAAVLEACAIIPTFISYWCFAGVCTFASVLSFILTLLVMPLAAIIICCLLGFIIALIAPHVKHKSLILTIVYALFFIPYLFLCMQLGNLMELLLSDVQSLGNGLKAWAFPFYEWGVGATGNFGGFAVFAAIIIAAFALLYVVLSVTFLSLTTTKKQGKKAKYKEDRSKRVPQLAALIKKEAKRFYSNTAYLVNCGFGVVFLVVMAIGALVLRSTFAELFQALGPYASCAPVVVFGIVAFTVGCTPVTAPSVSLEGKTLWILRSMPVSTEKMLLAKVLNHLIFIALPLVFAVIALACSFPMDAASMVLFILCSLVFAVFVAVVGLALGIKYANLEFVSEAMAVKQGAAVLFTILSTMLPSLVLSMLYVAICTVIPPWAWLTVMLFVITAATLLLIYWLKNKGVKRFEQL